MPQITAKYLLHKLIEGFALMLFMVILGMVGIGTNFSGMPTSAWGYAQVAISAVALGVGAEQIGKLVPG